MDLQQLAACTRLPLRKLRYVIDHELVPGLDFKMKTAANEVGRPRRLADDAAFAVAWVAVMLTGGVQRTTATQFLAAVIDLPCRGPSDEPRRGHELLARLTSVGGEGRASFAEGRYVRLQLIIHDIPYDTGWCVPDTGHNLVADYSPRLVLESDLGQLRREIFGPS